MKGDHANYCGHHSLIFQAENFKKSSGVRGNSEILPTLEDLTNIT